METLFLEKRGRVLLFGPVKKWGTPKSEGLMFNPGVVRRPDDYHWGFIELLKDPLFTVKKKQRAYRKKS